MDCMNLEKTMKKILALAGLLLAICPPAQAQNVALLLFDAETGKEFAGCLNCNRYDDGSVCNAYGDHGSRYSDESIWNRYGKFGSSYEENSPWNRYGEGLIIVDRDGKFYGHFSANRFADGGQSRLPLIRSMLELQESGVELDEIRDLLCE